MFSAFSSAHLLANDLLYLCIANFGPQLVDAFFRLVSLGGAGLLTNDIIIIDDRCAIVLPFVVKLGDAERVAGRFVLQSRQIFARLLRFFAVRITKEKILKTSSRLADGVRIFCAGTRRRIPKITDLILRISRERLVREFVDHRLVSCNRRIRQSLFFPGETDIKLGAGGVFPVGRAADNGCENLDGGVEHAPNGDAEQLALFPAQKHFADAKLRFDGLIEMRALRIFFDDIAICRLPRANNHDAVPEARQCDMTLVGQGDRADNASDNFEYIFDGAFRYLRAAPPLPPLWSSPVRSRSLLPRRARNTSLPRPI